MSLKHFLKHEAITRGPPKANQSKPKTGNSTAGTAPATSETPNVSVETPADPRTDEDIQMNHRMSSMIRVKERSSHMFSHLLDLITLLMQVSAMVLPQNQ